MAGIAAVGVALAAYAVRREIADHYRVAQLMDEQLSLQDSLSTAWFVHNGAAAENKTAAAYQLNHAEQLAEGADPRQAFPFRRGRAWIVAAALFALAVGLFSARYLVTRELDLKRSFLPFNVTQVFETFVKRGSKPDPDKPNGGDQSRTLPPGALTQEDSDKAQKSEIGIQSEGKSAIGGGWGKRESEPVA